MTAGHSQSHGVTLADVVITERLASRPARPANLQAENAALHGLARHLADGREALLSTLTHIALELCASSGSAGVSLLEDTPDGQVFRWVALAGQLAPYVGGTTPRDFSPCGGCLDRNSPQLYRYPDRLFTYFAAAKPTIVEGLVLPLSINGTALGTIWVVSHDESHGFDAEDVRVMSRLADFTAAAYRLNQEVAERKRSEAALREMDERKDRFLATLAHELRQPLAAMMPALAVMRDRHAKDIGQKAREAIERQVEHLRHLVDDLLDLARVSHGHVVLQTERCDLRDIVRETTFTSAHLFERGPELDVALPPQPVWVRADRTRLQQVLSNLLSNACRHTACDGRIEVHLTMAAAATAHLRVVDTGSGIAATHLPHVFDAFVQVGQHRGQLGIGLAIVRELVTLHGGRVEAHSDGLGRGSTFTVQLPVVHGA